MLAVSIGLYLLAGLMLLSGFIQSERTKDPGFKLTVGTTLFALVFGPITLVGMTLAAIIHKLFS